MTTLLAPLVQSGQRIVITGVSGWLGRTAATLLHDLLGPDAFAERVVAFGSSARPVVIHDGLTVRQHALADLPAIGRRPTLLLHLAFLTKDRAEAMDEQAYEAANVALREQVLGSLEGIGVEGCFIASSGAAARCEDPAASPAMRSYGRLKREDEDALAAWAEAHGRRAVITRIYSLSGAYINKPEVYALSAFVRDALAGRPVLVRAARPVFRSFVPAAELVALVLHELMRPGTVDRFDSGGEPIEMGDLAALVSDVLGGGGVLRPDFDPGGAADHYYGDNRLYRERLAASGLPVTGLPQQVADTADYLSGQLSQAADPRL